MGDDGTSAIDALIDVLHRYAAGDDGHIASSSSTDQSLVHAVEDWSVSDTHTSRQDAQEVGDEIMALKAIYGDESIVPVLMRRGRLADTSASTGDLSGKSDKNALDTSEDNIHAKGHEAAHGWNPADAIRLAVTVALDVPGAVTPEMRLLVTLPPGYPRCDGRPHLQLLSRYIGSHGMDFALFGLIMRIYRRANAEDGETTVESEKHVAFQPGQVALFDGIDKARGLVEDWYTQQEASRLQRAEDQGRSSNQQQDQPHVDGQKQSGHRQPQGTRSSAGKNGTDRDSRDQNDVSNGPRGSITPSSFRLVSAPSIVERKSTFVGHAAYLKHPSEVAPALAHLVASDRRIARATHPTMHAWICRTGDGVVHRDCDDDGETAAGGRLAHLLDLLHLDNVLVVVTRWYGGVHLGPDRFKLINRAARDALELLGAVDGPMNVDYGSTVGEGTTAKRNGNSRR